jgi:hypothetical protein
VDRNTEGQLTQVEREELEALVELSETISLLRVQALQVLGRSFPKFQPTTARQPRKPGSAKGKLVILEDDETHLDDFKRSGNVRTNKT